MRAVIPAWFAPAARAEAAVRVRRRVTLEDVRFVPSDPRATLPAFVFWMHAGGPSELQVSVPWFTGAEHIAPWGVVLPAGSKVWFGVEFRHDPPCALRVELRGQFDADLPAPAPAPWTRCATCGGLMAPRSVGGIRVDRPCALCAWGGA